MARRWEHLAPWGPIPMGVSHVKSSVDSLLEQAKALPLSEREELAARLNETLPPPPELPEHWHDEESAEAAWQAELERRLDDVASGTEDLVPWDQALEEMRESLKRKHGQ